MGVNSPGDIHPFNLHFLTGNFLQISNMDKFGEYDKQNIPCLESVGNKINGDMYGDLKYYGNKIFW